MLLTRWANLRPRAAPIFIAVEVNYGKPSTTSPIAYIWSMLVRYI